ncbi:MAG: DUF1194 domain-containing protein [Maritimibacter sp.]|nr:DUF1194 domain-containing protein [Maritimibacter sp.]
MHPRPPIARVAGPLIRRRSRPHRRAAVPLVAAALAALLAALPAPAAAQSCRQALALGLDVSGSVDAGEYRLQLDGLAAALTHPDVADALLAVSAPPVQLAVYEWSGPTAQAMILDWTAVTDTGVLADVAARLRATRRAPADPSTGLGAAILTGARLLARVPACWQRTLDISGDGVSNTGPRPQDLDAPELAGITVNALVIGPEARGAPEGVRGLLGYFETEVIRGPGAFAEPALDFHSYEAAMVRKLLRELQGLVISAAEPAAGPASGPAPRPERTSAHGPAPTPTPEPRPARGPAPTP